MNLNPKSLHPKHYLAQISCESIGVKDAIGRLSWGLGFMVEGQQWFRLKGLVFGIM